MLHLSIILIDIISLKGNKTKSLYETHGLQQQGVSYYFQVLGTTRRWTPGTL